MTETAALNPEETDFITKTIAEVTHETLAKIDTLVVEPMEVDDMIVIP